MKSVIFLFAACATAVADEIPKGEPVESRIFTKPYFEKNTSGLTGDASCLICADAAAFDKVFGVAFVMGKKPELLAKDDFEKKLVVAVIRRDNALFEYKNVQATTANGVLYLRYSAEKKGAGGMARFSSPLIVAVNRGDYRSIVFVENGKKAGTLETSKRER